MLENIRLQQRRQEQDQLAQELRAAVEPVGAEGAARADQPALPVQRAERHRLADPHAIRRAPTAPSSSSPRCSATRCADRSRSGRRSTRSWRSRAPISTSSRRASAAAALRDRRRARAGRALVPSMLLQTLVENAVKHGISQVRGPARSRCVARVAGDRLTLEVTTTDPAPARRPTHPAFRAERRELRPAQRARSAARPLRRRAALQLARDDDARPHRRAHRDAGGRARHRRAPAARQVPA